MPPKKRISESATPEADGEGGSAVIAAGDGSALPREQWSAMQDLLNYIYDYRTGEYVADAQASKTSLGLPYQC